jgi:DNA polymerase
LVLTVHDEIGSEVPLGAGDAKEYEALMCELPKWAEGFPIGAEGWIGPRYKKA